MEFWKLNMKEIRILKIIWELEFWKLNLGIGVLEIKFERNWSFEKYLKIKILDNYLKIEVLEIKFKSWKFGKLNFGIKIWRIKRMKCGGEIACQRWPCKVWARDGRWLLWSTSLSLPMWTYVGVAMMVLKTISNRCLQVINLR